MVTAAFAIGNGDRAARLALRRTLRGRSGPSLSIVHRQGGAPAAWWMGKPLANPLSIADRDGRAAAAVAAPGMGVGVDLDRDEPLLSAAERYFLSPGERDRAAGLSGAALWVLKEAAWKALACDDATPFTSLRLELRAGRLEAIRLGEVRHPAGGRLMRPWPGYLAAVVWTPGRLQ